MTNRPISEDELRRLLADAVAQAGSQARWAETAGVSQAYVSAVLAGKIHPGESITQALGYKRRVDYVPDAWDAPPTDIWKGPKHGK